MFQKTGAATICPDEVVISLSDVGGSRVRWWDAGGARGSTNERLPSLLANNQCEVVKGVSTGKIQIVAYKMNGRFCVNIR